MTRTTIFIELGVWAHNRSLFTGEITMMSAPSGADVVRASAIGGTKQAITQTVGVLVERGYVERTPDPADGRAKVVTLTERGREAAKASLEIADEVDRAWETVLGAEEMEAFRSRLTALVGAARPGAGGWASL